MVIRTRIEEETIEAGGHISGFSDATLDYFDGKRMLRKSLTYLHMVSEVGGEKTRMEFPRLTPEEKESVRDRMVTYTSTETEKNVLGDDKQENERRWDYELRVWGLGAKQQFTLRKSIP